MKKQKGKELKITLSGGKKNRQILTLGDNNNNNHDRDRCHHLEQRVRDMEKLVEALRELIKEKDKVIRLLERKR